MNSASVHVFRRGRLLATLAGLLAVAALTADLDGGAVAKAPPKTTPTTPAGASASSTGASEGMRYEQVIVINEQIEAQWKANKA